MWPGDLPIWAGQKALRNDNRCTQLYLQNICVSHDGNSTQFDVHIPNRGTVVANIELFEVDALISQLQSAAKEMRRRQRVYGGSPHDQVRDLAEIALEPAKSDAYIEPTKGDVIFLHRFESHEPVAIRLSPDQLKILRAKTNAALARLAN